MSMNSFDGINKQMLWYHAKKAYTARISVFVSTTDIFDNYQINHLLNEEEIAAIQMIAEQACKRAFFKQYYQITGYIPDELKKELAEEN